MSSSTKRLGFLVLAISTLMIYWGCSQPEDVITPVVASRLTLTPERLPTNPAGTVYQLWAANSTDTVAVAKFAWNFDSNAFFEVNGTTRRADSNAFILPDDIFNFRTVIVSVEPVPDNNVGSPNAIMLLDTVVTLEPETTRLRFPRSDSLYNGFTAINFETPSDTEINDNDGYGVWFSGYQAQGFWLRDTVAVANYVIDTSGACDTLGTFECPDSIVIVDLVNFRTEIVERYFGLDTFTAQVVRYDSVIRYDAVAPYTDDKVTFTYTLSPVNDSTLIIGDDFLTNDIYLPDFSEFGWVYRGWVMSPALDGGCGNASFSEPAWVNTSAIDQYFPQNGSSMISTGTFDDFSGKDLGANPNPFSLGTRVPNLPGEDFLSGLPCGGGLPTGGFVPAGGGPVGANGAVFISLEPANYTAATNFPLIPLVATIPTNRNAISIGGFGQGSLVAFQMRNWTSATHNDLQGFPLIIVDIERL